MGERDICAFRKMGAYTVQNLVEDWAALCSWGLKHAALQQPKKLSIVIISQAYSVAVAPIRMVKTENKLKG